jgi:hypothetical protein
MMRRCVWLFSAVVFILFAFVSVTVAADLTADSITKAGKRTTPGKIAVKGDKFRLNPAYTPIYNIGRGDKGVLWEINGAEKTYGEAKLIPALKPRIDEKLPGEISRKQVGQETIDGYNAKKSEVTVKEDNKTVVYYQWWVADLGFPVKLAKTDGSWSVEYKNIKKGAADSLFELPPDTTRDRSYIPEALTGGH